MIRFLLGAVLAMHLGPMGTDAAKEPQLAARGNLVGMTFGAGGAIYFSASHDAGRTFSPPAKVSEAAVVPLNRHRGPRIAITANAIVITAVTGRTLSTAQHAHGLPSDGDLMAWRSTDDGRTWSGGVVINDVPGAPTEGLHGLAAAANGTLFAAWLDKRSEKGTKLYGSRSTDGGRTWSKNVAIYESPDGTICECCHPSVAFDDSGKVAVMFRNWLDGSRDMYLATSADGVSFSKPMRLGMGTWKLNACPMDGGGLVVAQGRLVSVWRRDAGIFEATPGEREKEIGSGIDIGVAGGANGAYAIWTAKDGVRAIVPGRSGSTLLAPEGGFPSIVALPGGRALAAWEQDGKIVVQGVR
jgi:BNR repeat-like domain